MRGRATLAELNTVYSLEDLYDITEMVEVETYNERRMDEWVKMQER